MYESALEAAPTGVLDVDVDVDRPDGTGEDPDAECTSRPSLSVTVTFAVTTDETAKITVRGDGTVLPSFGGTGTSQAELDEYARTAVKVWRAVTGDVSTVCRYQPRSPEDRRQSPTNWAIHA